MRKWLSIAAIMAIAILSGCDRDEKEIEKRRDLTPVPNVSDTTKTMLRKGENDTYKQSKAEIEKLHKQVQKDMTWDYKHHTWHEQYPIVHATVAPPSTPGFQVGDVVTSNPTANSPPLHPTDEATVPPVFQHALPSGVTRKALLVGINRYPGCPLNGCVNDVTDIKAFLKTYFGFQDNEIVVLSDEQATTANITQALLWLCGDAKPGDPRVFWYSGHGAEFAGADVANQPDHQNQVMCPVDFDWSEQRMLQDVQLHKIFVSMPNGVVFNWGSDSCHSGDLDKAIKLPGRVARRYPLPPPPAVAANLAAVKAKRGIPHRGLVAGELEVGFLSGCQYDETSADTQDDSGRPCGAMTHYFLQTIKQAGYMDKPLTTIAAAMNTIMDEYKYDQHPQTEGNRKGKAWLQP